MSFVLRLNIVYIFKVKLVLQKKRVLYAYGTSLASFIISCVMFIRTNVLRLIVYIYKVKRIW